MNQHELVQGIYQSQPWEEKLTEPLTSLGFEKPDQAWKNLATLAVQTKFPSLHPEFFPTLLELISKSYQADTALLNFERFTEKILDKNYLYTLLSESSSLLKALITLFSGSQVLTDTLLNDPSHFDWLKNPDTLGKSKSKDVLMRDFFEMAGEDYLSKKTPSLLRRFKKREYIRSGFKISP